jgi:hypothetical protein
MKVNLYRADDGGWWAEYAGVRAWGRTVERALVNLDYRLEGDSL